LYPMEIMLLAIDTSTKVFSIALVENRKVIHEIFSDSQQRHSDILFPSLDKLLKKTKKSLKDIKKVACTIGPGGFTSVRIGITFARTLAQLLKLPLVGISTLDLLARSIKSEENCIICPIIVGSGRDVYNSVYTYKPFKKIREYRIIEINELLDELKKTRDKCIIFTGDGILLHRNGIKSKLGKKAAFVDFKDAHPRASKIGLIASNSKGKDFSKIKPLYIRPPRIY